MDRLMWPLVILGHVGFWCFFFNRTHATAWPRAARKAIEKFVLAVVFIPLALCASSLWAYGWPGPAGMLGRNLFLASYGGFCAAFGSWLVGAWLVRRTLTVRPPAVRYLSREVLDLEQQTGQHLTAGWFAEALRRVPWNRCTWVEFNYGELVLNRPDTARWEGLKIAHLSDFHLTGGLTRPFYEAIVDRVNSENCDLVLLSGDLVDVDHCLDWIPEVFGRLQSRLGKYFVLGNHDLQISDQAGYLTRLQAAGCEYVTGRWRLIHFGPHPIALTGNDLPWYSGAEKLNEQPPADALKLCLAHSPDQWKWAASRGADVTFAGHTHGGQICFPLVGPVISPSKYGVRYAGGEYLVDSMLLLVSRGISGDEPIRWNCLPQVNWWTIQRARQPVERSADSSSETVRS